MMRWVFGADTTPFRRGLDEMRTQTKAFSGSVSKMMIGALGTGAIIAGFRNMLVEMDRVQKLGLRFGESAETIQKLSLAASLAGSDIEGIAKAMTLVTRNAANAAQNGGQLAESFARAGIDAGKFVNLPLEQKVLILAQAFKEGEGSGTKLANMMEILGRSGGDLIPLLTQGQAELQEQFNNTATASQATVDAITRFNDAITTLKQESQVAMAAVFGFFQLFLTGFGALITGPAQQGIVWLKFLAGAAMDAGSIIKNALSGDLEAAGKAFERLGRRGADSFQESVNKAKALRDVLNDALDDTFGGGTTNKGGPDAGEAAAAAEAAIKTESERKKLAEEIAKLQEEARFKELSLAQQILDVEKKRAALLAEIDAATTETEGLQKTKEALEAEKELAKLKEQQQKNSETAAKKEEDERIKTAEKIASLEAESAAIDREQNLAGMSESDRMAALIAERTALEDESISAGLSGDRETELEKGIAAKNLTPEIDALAKSIADESNAPGPIPGVATSSLASIGAGGSANLLTRDTTAERQVSLLEVIARNTARTETGSTKIPEPI